MNLINQKLYSLSDDIDVFMTKEDGVFNQPYIYAICHRVRAELFSIEDCVSMGKGHISNDEEQIVINWLKENKEMLLNLWYSKPISHFR